jgi:hypothetical protein
MSKMLKRVIAICLLAALAGCAGKDFVRPDAATLKLGRTTYAEIIAANGKPYREGVAVKHEKTVKTSGYAYASMGGKPAHDGVVPARGMNFYFLDDTLVGYEFISSWAEDQTDFDEAKLGSIVKGKTTRAEAIAAFGSPGGYYVYPMIKAATGEAMVYAYLEVGGSTFSRKIYNKVLVVTLDDAGVVSDTDYSSSGTR